MDSGHHIKHWKSHATVSNREHWTWALIHMKKINKCIFVFRWDQERDHRDRDPGEGSLGERFHLERERL